MPLSYASLFTGIGGFDLAAQKLGMKCVFMCEIDPYAIKTLNANFTLPGGIHQCDVFTINRIPRHDILLGGFPCPDFSFGGKQVGFRGKQGKLFFELLRITKINRPKMFLFENVRMKKCFLDLIQKSLEDLGYDVYNKILNSHDFGVPQNRGRNLWVGFRSDLKLPPFVFPKATNSLTTLADILEPNSDNLLQYGLSKRYWKSLRAREARHIRKGSGFRYTPLGPSDVANTLTTSGSGHESNLIKCDLCSTKVRKMTPREWARLQGFPDSFVIPVSNAQAYKQFGNAVTVKVIKAVLKQMMKYF